MYVFAHNNALRAQRFKLQGRRPRATPSDEGLGSARLVKELLMSASAWTPECEWSTGMEMVISRGIPSSLLAEDRLGFAMHDAGP